MLMELILSSFPPSLHAKPNIQQCLPPPPKQPKTAMKSSVKPLESSMPNFLHFIPISLLFLPLTFSTVAAIQFYKSSSPDINSTTYFDPPNLCLIKAIITSSPLKTLTIILAFTISVILPTVAGIASITYSTNQAIHHKQLTFSSTVKSLSNSYIPLLSTVIAGLIKLILFCLLLTLSPIAITETIKAPGFPSDIISLISIFINTIVFYVLLFTVGFFIKIWGSGPAIAVLELKSGFQPLRQSANQSTEFRSRSYSIVFLSVFVIGSMLANSAVFPIIGSTAPKWIWILNVCLICSHSSLMILQYVVANTVLYVQCKVVSGDEIVKSAVKGEVSGEYVNVGVDGGEDEVEVKKFGAFDRISYAFLVLWLSIMLPQLIWWW